MLKLLSEKQKHMIMQIQIIVIIFF